ncbi:3-hydroxyacyl-CoA dehydrogenase family protein [Amycolatopsis sp. cg13]|uniref:3-hydroxyacyl-CoA dehydrogenase family protein n=1 Tax=Amycolatopsis sp. cg13 TaxID=3238807 RepID=UPI003526BF79
MSDIKSVAVIGGGFMGAGIAESTAAAGIPVVVRDLPEFLDAARRRVDASLAQAVQRGKLDEAARDALRSRISFTADLADAGGADLVVEAVPERLELKVGIMQALDEIVGEHAIIASNTSSIPIAQLGGAVRNADRVIGVHFFSPVPVMKLVEVVCALDTSQETADKCIAYVEQLGKHPIVTKDRSGFIVNFLLTPYLMGAVRMFEEGFASREDIDAGMKLGANHPIGPLQLCDFIGLDVLNSVCNSLYEEFKREEYAPPPLMKRMIAAGRLGRKSGRGFYEYP